MTKFKLYKRITQKATLLGLILCAPVMAEEKNQALEILQSMSAEIASLESFVITGDGYTDSRLDAGQLIENSSDVVLRVKKPDALRITNNSAESTGEVFFSEGVLSVYNGTQNFYAQTPLPAGLDEAVRFAVDEVGIEAPVLDLISSDVASYLIEGAESVDYFGLSQFRGKSHHHIGIRTADIDLQIWVLAEGAPLPAKMAISSKWEGGSPRSVFFFSWNTAPDIDRRKLRFEPPAGAIKIEFDLEAEQ
ncbi:MAG: DUF2092 domain-containing protein [Pseudomonadales bacterium]